MCMRNRELICKANEVNFTSEGKMCNKCDLKLEILPKYHHIHVFAHVRKMNH